MNRNTNVSTLSTKGMTATVDAKGTLGNLEHIFSSNSCCITEILQNARRAASTHCEVEILSTPLQRDNGGIDNVLNQVIITDNGNGIDDFSKLFCFSSSGWEQHIQIQENSFGVGLFSVLFFAERISIESNGIKHDFTKDQILNSSDGSTVSVSDVTQGTKITLTNPFEKNADKIATLIENSVVSMPYNVQFKHCHYGLNNFVNNRLSIKDRMVTRDVLLKPFASADLLISAGLHDAVPFEFGVAFIPKETFHFNASNILSYACGFLQSLPILLNPPTFNRQYHSTVGDNKKFNSRIVFHLNDDVPATHPDRNLVHNSIRERVSKALETAVISYCFDKFIIKVDDALTFDLERQSKFFASNYLFMRENEITRPLIKRFNFVHFSEFSVIDDYTVINDFFPELSTSDVDLIGEAFSKEVITDVNPLLITLDPRDMCHNFAAYFLTKFLDRPVYVVSDSFETPEWMATTVVNFDECEFVVSAVDGENGKSFNREFFNSETIEQQVIFCQQVSLVINSPGFNFEGTSKTLPLALNSDVDNDSCIYLPYNITHTPSIDHVSRNLDSNGDIVDHSCHIDYANFLTVNLSQDINSALVSQLQILMDELRGTRLGVFCQDKAISLSIKSGVVSIV